MTPEVVDHPDFSWADKPRLARIRASLAAAGGVSRYVGGCVRDTLFGHPPFSASGTTDIDIATTLTPPETIAALEADGIRAVPTGMDHGTITAVCDDQVAEITTLRADIDTDGRHATVAFTQDWEEDWRRRDFTMNAIYYAPETGLYDPAGGIAAARAREVIFIGDAATRLREDYLRMLRFYRFSARFARETDMAGRDACRAAREGLQKISAERIRAELLKLLALPRGLLLTRQMAEDGILAEIWPDPPDFSRASAVTLPALPQPKELSLLRLAALWPQAGPSLDNRLRLSNAEAKFRRRALALSREIGADTRMQQAKIHLYHQGADIFIAALRLSLAGKGGDVPPPALDLFRLAGDWPVPVFPLKAADFTNAGLTPGPALGSALKKAEEDWISRGFPDNAAALGDIIQSAVKSVSG